MANTEQGIQIYQIENFGTVELDAIYFEEEGRQDEIEYYDLYDKDGNCLNLGEPFYDEEPTVETITAFLFPKDESDSPCEICGSTQGDGDDRKHFDEDCFK
jgi:hypothetical protein